MAIEIQVPVVVAAAEVLDDYNVELRVARKRTSLSWEDAEALALELTEAVADARRMLAEDQAARDPVHQAGFDVDLMDAASVAQRVLGVPRAD